MSDRNALAAAREQWSKKVGERLASGPATSGALAAFCGERGNDKFYGWLRTQTVFPRAGKVVGASGMVNIQFKRVAKP